MKQTEDQLNDLIVYEAVSGIRALAPPTLEKAHIPSLIHCHLFDKAVEKRDRLMERYTQKVNTQKEKVAGLESEIAHLTKEIKKRTDGSFLGDMMGRTLTGTKPGIFDNAEEHNKKAAKYNAILEVVRRLEDQRERAVDRHNDAVAKHNEAVEEANEKLEELTAEALQVIDDDMVAVMDKVSKIGLKLSGSQNAEDLLASVEICFLQLKLGLVLEDHIEGNAQRHEFKDRLDDVDKLLTKLCASPQMRHRMVEAFQRNIDLIAKNRGLHVKVLEAIKTIDSESLDEPAKNLQGLFRKQINTSFEYKHLIDPRELDEMVVQINQVIIELKDHVASVNSAAEVSGAPAQRAMDTQRAIVETLHEMKSNYADMANEVLTDAHFACELLNENVIDDFLHRDVKLSAKELREHVRQSVKPEEFDALMVANDDQYFISRTEAAIQRADLMRLRVELDKVQGYLKTLADLIAGAEADIDHIGKVPREQAESFRAKAFTTYLLCCLPWVGVGFALSLLSRIRSFEAAFKSTNGIYRQLSSDILEKNGTMKTASLILAGVLGLGGIILFLALGISDSVIVKIGVPGSAAALYLATMLVFGSVERQIEEYELVSGALPSESEGGLRPLIGSVVSALLRFEPRRRLRRVMAK